MTLQYFATHFCDRMYEPRLSEEQQCGGWYALKRMVERGHPISSDWDSLHPKLIPFIWNHWDKIKELEIE